MMGDVDLNALAEDIRKNGLIHPIVILDGAAGRTMLDGRNRAAACRRANVEPRFQVLTDAECESPVGYIIAANVHRRHLTPEQRAELAADPGILDAFRKEAKARQRAGGHEGGSKAGRGRVPDRVPADDGGTLSGRRKRSDQAREAVTQAAKVCGVSRDRVYKVLRAKKEAAMREAGIREAAKTPAPSIPDSPSKPTSSDPRVIRKDARDVRIRSMVEEGKSVGEISKVLHCSKGLIHQAIVRMSLRPRKEENPLRRLTAYAVEFCDTWDVVILANPSWASATPEQVSTLIGHLQDLNRKTNQLIRRLKKEAAYGDLDESGQAIQIAQAESTDD
jgi:hypothetical protein